MPETCTFKIKTLPISTNDLKISVIKRGRPMQIKSPAYRTWQARAGYEINSQRGFDCAHPFLWSSVIEFPCNVSKLDLDNCEKAIFDLLNLHKKCPDDRYQCAKSSKWIIGETFIVHITREPLEHWLTIKKYSPPTIKKLRKGYPT